MEISPEPQPLPLKQYLLEAIKSPSRSMETLPQAIDLGEFGREAERLIQLSLADPKHPEFGSVACVDTAGRILLLNTPVRGETDRVELPKFKGKKTILTIHTHGDADVPFSSSDVKPLILDPTDSDDEEVPAALLVTPNLKLLLIRTKNTPFLSRLDLLDVEDAIDQNATMQDERKASQRYAQWSWGHTDSTEPPFRGWKQEFEEIAHKRMFALSRAAHKFSLRMYTCSSDKNIAQLAS